MDRKWSKEEKEILIKYYENTSNKEIQEKYLPNRTISQIYDYASKKLKLHKPKDKKIKIDKDGVVYGWSKEDEEFVKDNYEYTDWDILINHLNKNKAAITAKAIELGIKRHNYRVFWTDEEIEILKKYYPTTKDNEMMQYFSNKNFRHIKYMANKLCLKKDEEYLRETKIKIAMNNLALIGDQKGGNSPIWTRVSVKCTNCGKEIFRKKSQIEKSKSNHFFCNSKCQGEYMSVHNLGENNPMFGKGDEVWTDEMRDKKRLEQIQLLKRIDNNYNLTKPQLIINNLLIELGITFENEYDCKYYMIDNFLKEYNLMIEIQGNFYHCNPVMNLENSREEKIIRKDRSKHTYIKKYYDIEVLYLWEKDILENIELCKQLIIKYINNDGVLEDYHSFNYKLNKLGNLETIESKYIIGY